jgi:hypothetical protein
VTRLAALNGQQLPPRAWGAFGAARGVVVALDGHGLEALAQALRLLAAQLPRGLHSVAVCWAGSSKPLQELLRTRQAVAAAVGGFLQQLLAQPCAAGLQRLQLLNGVAVGPRAAASLQQGLPGLQQLELAVLPPQLEVEPATLPGLPCTIQDLTIHPSNVALAPAALQACCARLRSLRLELCDPQQLPAGARSIIGRCTRLQQLHVQLHPTSSAGCQQALGEVLAGASGLPRLQAFLAPQLDVAAAAPGSGGGWACLAQMPALQQLQLGRVALAGGSAAAAACLPSVQRLLARDISLPPAGEAAGVLARALPGLRSIRIGAARSSHGAIASALQRHGRLEELELRSAEPWQQLLPRAPWPPGRPLHSMPRLRVLVLHGDARLQEPDCVLQDAAGCPQLQQLSIRPASHGGRFFQHGSSAWFGATGVAALARGACRDTLQMLELVHAERAALEEHALHLPALAASDVALLLQGGLPRLRELSVELRLEAAQLAADEAGGGAGAAAAVAQAQPAARQSRPSSSFRAMQRRAAGAGSSKDLDMGRVEALLPRWVARQLAAQGAREVTGLRVVRDGSSSAPHRVVQGSAGPCQLALYVQP